MLERGNWFGDMIRMFLIPVRVLQEWLAVVLYCRIGRNVEYSCGLLITRGRGDIGTTNSLRVIRLFGE